jgi:hypothetical protein
VDKLLSISLLAFFGTWAHAGRTRRVGDVLTEGGNQGRGLAMSKQPRAGTPGKKNTSNTNRGLEPWNRIGAS